MLSPGFLIVNADDFGQSPGINRGVIEAHEHGILTSASVMVRFPAARDAAAYAVAHPRLSLGLHLDLGEWICREGAWSPLYHVVDVKDPAAVRTELTRQLDRFRSLLGRDPTHLDSHQHVHLQEPVRAFALEEADRLGIPLRGCTSRIHYCGRFYGQTDAGAPNLAALSVTGLSTILAKLGPGVHELGCHPGYLDDQETMYREKREREVTVLCDPEARAVVAAAGFELRSFNDLP